MINKPLLEKETLNHYKKDNKDSIIYLKYNDVVEALKKFKSAEIEYDSPENCCKCKNENTFFVEEFDNELPNDYCFDCWFKECFGVLPKEEKKW